MIRSSLGYGEATGLQLEGSKKLSLSGNDMVLNPVHVFVQFAKFSGLPLNVPRVNESKKSAPHSMLIALLLLIVPSLKLKNPPGLTLTRPLLVKTAPESETDKLPSTVTGTPVPIVAVKEEPPIYNEPPQSIDRLQTKLTSE